VLISKEELTRYLHPEKESNQAAPACPSRTGGRKPKYDWDKIEAEALKLMDYHDEFSPDDPEWNAQACLVTDLQKFYLNTFGYEPSDSSLKAKIPKWLEKWRATKLQPETETKAKSR